MGHVVDKDLLSLVQTEVKGTIKDLTLQSAQLFQVHKTAAVLQVRLDERDARLDAVEEKHQEDEETRRVEMKIILDRLGSVEKLLSEELLREMQGMKESLAVTNTEVKELRQTVGKMEQLEESHVKTRDRMGQLEHGLTKVEQLKQDLARTDDNVKNLQEGQNKTSNRVDQLEHEVKSQMMKDVKQGELNREKVTFDSIRAVVI